MCTGLISSFSGRAGLLYAATYLQDKLGWAEPVIPRSLVTAVAQVCDAFESEKKVMLSIWRHTYL
jgi:hypothetical protein